MKRVLSRVISICEAVTALWRVTGWQSLLPPDLVAVTLLAITGASVAILEAPVWLRLVFGLPLVIFCPGYALIRALFPTKDGPDGVARNALGIALSLATIPVLGLVINQSPWKLETTSIAGGLLLVVLAAVITSIVRQQGIAAEDRYSVSLTFARVAPPRTWQRSTVLSVGLGMVALGLIIGGGASVIRTYLTGVPLTEFALFNASGEARFYPREISVGEAVDVQVAVTNREGHALTYLIVVAGSGVATVPPAQLELADGETALQTISFTVTASGENLLVRFELRRLDQANTDSPYRLLQLRVTGVPSIS